MFVEFSGYRQIILISQRKLDLHIPTHELKQLIIFKNKILRINVDFQLIDADVRGACNVIYLNGRVLSLMKIILFEIIILNETMH